MFRQSFVIGFLLRIQDDLLLGFPQVADGQPLPLRHRLFVVRLLRRDFQGEGCQLRSPLRGQQHHELHRRPHFKGNSVTMFL